MLGEVNESWHIQSWPDVRVPPLLAACPLTERAIWAPESQRQAHPSLCPALQACSQGDRLGELAGISASGSRQAGSCSGGGSVQRGQTCMFHCILCNRVASAVQHDWSQACSSCAFNSHKVHDKPRLPHFHIGAWLLCYSVTDPCDVTYQSSINQAIRTQIFDEYKESID